MSPFNAVLDVQFSDESSTEPIVLDYAKNWCRIDVSDDDALISILIKVARQQCEKFTNISFIARTVTATINNSCGGIYLPYQPIAGDITLTDNEGKAITDFETTSVLFKQLLTPCENNLKAEYGTGYETLPDDLKTAVVQQVAYLYENRGDEQKMQELSPMAKTILKQHRRI